MAMAWTRALGGTRRGVKQPGSELQGCPECLSLEGQTTPITRRGPLGVVLHRIIVDGWRKVCRGLAVHLILIPFSSETAPACAFQVPYLPTTRLHHFHFLVTVVPSSRCSIATSNHLPLCSALTNLHSFGSQQHTTFTPIPNPTFLQVVRYLHQGFERLSS